MQVNQSPPPWGCVPPGPVPGAVNCLWRSSGGCEEQPGEVNVGTAVLLQYQRGLLHPLTATESPLVEKWGEGMGADSVCPAGAVWVQVFLQSL